MATDGIFYVLARVSDLARSKRFYGETLGWTLSTDAGFAFATPTSSCTPTTARRPTAATPAACTSR